MDLAFAIKNDGGIVVIAAQQVLREVQLALREETAVLKRFAGLENLAALFADDFAFVPDAVPEFFLVRDRPAPEILVPLK